MLVRTTLLGILLLLFILLLLPILLVSCMLLTRWPLQVYGRGFLRLAVAFLGLKVEVLGRDNVDRNSTYVYMANHLSIIDGPLLFMLIPQSVRVILKKSAFRIPVIGLGMLFYGFVPVDRKGFKQGKRSILKAVELMKRKGYSFLIFPEGTRSRDGRLQPFKRGGFFLAMESGAPILPVSIQGTYALMPRGRSFIRKGRIRVRFHPPIPVSGAIPEDLQTVIPRTRDAIRSGLSEDA